MEKAIVLVLRDYDVWANKHIIAAAVALPPEALHHLFTFPVRKVTFNGN